MRKDECLFCSSRRCTHRVVSSDIKDFPWSREYDEIACRKHMRDLYKHADLNCKGTKIYMETTGRYCRGDEV